jgi:hypothetical protein
VREEPLSDKSREPYVKKLSQMRFGMCARNPAKKYNIQIMAVLSEVALRK